MSKINRRKAIGMIMGWTFFLSSLPGCFLFRSCKKDPSWKKKAKEFWSARVKQRNAQRAADRRQGIRPNIETPYPYLTCIESSSRGSFRTQIGPSFHPLPSFRPIDMHFTIKNTGNAATSACQVELYEGPVRYEHKKYSELILRSRIVTSILPGQEKEVSMKFWALRPIGFSVIARCYDPILDPGVPAYEPDFRQNISAFYR